MSMDTIALAFGLGLFSALALSTMRYIIGPHWSLRWMAAVITAGLVVMVRYSA